MKKTMERITELDSLDKLQRLDHDTLIRLESKVDSVLTDIKDLKEGTTTKLADHELRLRVLEKLAEQYQPELNLKKLNEVYQWKHDFQVTWKVILATASAVGGIVGFLLEMAFRIFGR